MMNASDFMNRIMQRKRTAQTSDYGASGRAAATRRSASFADHPVLRDIRMLRMAAASTGLSDPFFRMHDGMGGAATVINGREYINFSHYNYLGLNGHPEILEAVNQAVARYGTSVGASRLVAGERPIQRELESELASVYSAESALVFVSGHATNVSAIAALFGPKDLILHDALSHNSIVEGCRLSGATRRPYPHNNPAALEAMLEQSRDRYERALIVTEGLFSMDGDIPDLEALVGIKQRYDAFLMVDEAHALGVLGQTGLGLAEYCDVDPSLVDIWMGTLSKTLVSCGGYIAGSSDLIEILRCAASGFVYSVGISPANAAAALQALRIFRREPERVERLRANGEFFLETARKCGLNTGHSVGGSIAPVIIGSSRKAVALSEKLFDAGVNVQPIIHPAVEERAARLRFFVSADHEEAQIEEACGLLANLSRG